jgi:hypothetical protein
MALSANWRTTVGKRHKPEEIVAKLRQVEVMTGQGGLPHIAAPGIRLESGRYRPASGLAGAQRRADEMLAARSSPVPAGDSRARNVV